MNREQFYGQLATLDEQRLKKALWNLYWRGSAATRERIEAEIGPDQQNRGKRLAKEPADPQRLLDEVGDFVALARSGAYMAGDRRVSPRERTRWRFTFQRLVTDAQDGLRAEDAGAAATAVEQLIDLACETRDYDYFRSGVPLRLDPQRVGSGQREGSLACQRARADVASSRHVGRVRRPLP